MILFGPPGCGKTTLARLIAAETGARFVQLSAVSSGTADVRAAIQGAREARTLSAARTVLFIDEIHRFNKAQQDALLPAIEDGIVALIGATTENPYFEVNSALPQPLRALPLRAAGARVVERVVAAALEDEERGLGGEASTLGDGALAYLAGISRGDARVALNALETAWRSRSAAAPGARRSPSTLDDFRTRPRSRRSCYDRGDVPLRHHLGVHQEHARQRRRRRGVLARLDDRRRRGSQVHRAAHGHLRQRGRRQRRPAARCRSPWTWRAPWSSSACPRARINLSQAATYLALAPKSNAAYKAVDAALEDVRRAGNRPPPPHLRDANYRGAKELGHGAGYKYPHASGGWVEQQYLPDELSGRRYYVPIRGLESQMAARLDEIRRRAADTEQRPGRRPGPGQGKGEEVKGRERRLRRRAGLPRGGARLARGRVVLRAPGQGRPGHRAERRHRREGGARTDSGERRSACKELSAEPILLKQGEEGVRVQIEHRPMLPLMAFAGQGAVSAAFNEAAARVSERWGPRWVVLLSAREDGTVSAQRLA